MIRTSFDMKKSLFNNHQNMCFYVLHKCNKYVLNHANLAFEIPHILLHIFIFCPWKRKIVPVSSYCKYILPVKRPILRFSFAKKRISLLMPFSLFRSSVIVSNTAELSRSHDTEEPGPQRTSCAAT